MRRGLPLNDRLVPKIGTFASPRVNRAHRTPLAPQASPSAPRGVDQHPACARARSVDAVPLVTLLLIDNTAVRVLSASRTGDAVRNSRQRYLTRRPGLLRRIAALCLLLSYLLAGALHGACDLDVAHAPSGKPEIAALLDKAGHADPRGIADHHCHGCFSVAVPQLQLAVLPSDIVAATDWPIVAMGAGIPSDSDSPPPKHLI
ncbi:conserved hypothetical protein [Bradyrhizobium sp. STM 3809]|nr:conserved hypothetical protein [Bradyrhizobium sp. STM 3809]